MAYEQDRFTDVKFLRNDEPVLAAVSMDRLGHLGLTEEDMADVSLALARMLTTGPDRHSRILGMLQPEHAPRAGVIVNCRQIIWQC